ncbi:class I SAM-dependent methyltransferase [Piscirickettsia litoralis]|uniref:Methyltransferase domain-containing protein n=1 Tax=Piscirickettsia litoralis TaxID=1891921 RepID=A0ABX2ZZV7_9GAMM|nr:class I SAM-dependent methyltransferase [Piscirickettsia litoralis]ODN42043.1 hypothetical protein BGC07_02575 [Piscirickettsia litoralis]
MKIDHWNAQHYHDSSDMQYRIAHDILADETFHQNDTVLDIGCGSGKITVDIASLVKQGQVVGIDLSEQMITFANKQYKHIENLSFAQGDILDLQLKSEFTKVTTFNMLQWVSDFNLAFKRIYHCLKSNGRFIGGYFLKCYPIWDPVDELITQVHWQPYFKDYDAGFYQNERDYCQSALEQAGFDSSSVIEINKDYFFKDRAHFISHSKNWLPHLSRLPNDKIDRFLSELADSVIKQGYMNNKGNIIVSGNYITFKAIRSTT